MRRQLHLLATPGFLAGLALLLANDFLFKMFLHNWLTGKLSDFAGLFIFPLFWIAFNPQWKRAVFFLTALGFIFWKSQYSQPLITAWNSLALFNVERVVDSTDLLALAVLPASFFYASRVEKPPSPDAAIKRSAVRRFVLYSIALISLFAFTATQRADELRFEYEKQYLSSLSRTELAERLKNIGLERADRIRTTETANRPFRPTDYYTLTTKSRYCNGPVNAFLQVTERDQGAFLVLISIEYFCAQQKPEQKEEVLAIFEREVISGIAAEQIDKSGLK